MICSKCGLPQGTHGIDGGTGMCWSCRAKENQKYTTISKTDLVEQAVREAIAYDKASLTFLWERAYLAAITGLSTKDSYGYWDDMCEDAARIANATIRKHKEAATERDKIIKEILG